MIAKIEGGGAQAYSSPWDKKLGGGAIAPLPPPPPGSRAPTHSEDLWLDHTHTTR